MSMISQKKPLKDDHTELIEERVTRLKFALKFIFLFIVLITILAPCLEALLNHIKG